MCVCGAVYEIGGPVIVPLHAAAEVYACMTMRYRSLVVLLCATVVVDLSPCVVIAISLPDVACVYARFGRRPSIPLVVMFYVYA